MSRRGPPIPTSDRVYVYLQLPGSLEVVTAGYFEQTEQAGVRVGVFVYNPAYLDRADAVPLDPFELPLRPGRFETVKLKGIFGALRDASPDAWGRGIIERRLNSTALSEADYLLNSPEDRVGALSFGRGKIPPAPTRRFNQVIALASFTVGKSPAQLRFTRTRSCRSTTLAATTSMRAGGRCSPDGTAPMEWMRRSRTRLGVDGGEYDPRLARQLSEPRRPHQPCGTAG